MPGHCQSTLVKAERKAIIVNDVGYEMLLDVADAVEEDVADADLEELGDIEEAVAHEEAEVASYFRQQGQLRVTDELSGHLQNDNQGGSGVNKIIFF